jgi:hypothetical protein
MEQSAVWYFCSEARAIARGSESLFTLASDQPGSHCLRGPVDFAWIFHAVFLTGSMGREKKKCDSRILLRLCRKFSFGSTTCV